MGTGKTSVGKIVAKKLKLKFIDADSLIERITGMKISDIFDKLGENRFRDLETELVKNISNKKGVVISTGGGVVIREENLVNLKKNGIIFCLKASEETIYKRVKDNKDRPLLQVENPIERIRNLIKQRTSLYEKADFVIDTDGLSQEDVADKIIKEYERLEGGKNQS